ncbi:G-type lectin S-receptor-like serine/threonine-protein kinase [Artemisia annua]|uniref:G-type lectin S-receptor-like serine/threonine-protein kinase n=1 Tax=Artemisia annua TaxID=35608 RepID=A0A2U1NUG1_ARTAN|nr:G-type lectin S-receptor-like serine/threonine-protein kinase [Artemisia annua]
MLYYGISPSFYIFDQDLVSVIYNVHAVNLKFLETGEGMSAVKEDGEKKLYKGAYLMGKMFRAKGYRELVDLLCYVNQGSTIPRCNNVEDIPCHEQRLCDVGQLHSCGGTQEASILNFVLASLWGCLAQLNSVPRVHHPFIVEFKEAWVEKAWVQELEIVVHLPCVLGVINRVIGYAIGLPTDFEAPDNACDVYGVCGSFAICTNKSPICDCLKGFVPVTNEEWSQSNWTRGCVRQSEFLCEKNQRSLASRKSKPDKFQVLKGLKLPDRYQKNPDECQHWCMGNCSCKAYAFVTGIYCMAWMEDLIDVEQFSFGGVISSQTNKMDCLSTDLVQIIGTQVQGTHVLDLTHGAREAGPFSHDPFTHDSHASIGCRASIIMGGRKLGNKDLNNDVIVVLKIEIQKSDDIEIGKSGRKEYNVLMDQFHHVSTAFLELKRGYQEAIEDITMIMGAGMAGQLSTQVLMKNNGVLQHGFKIKKMDQYATNTKVSKKLWSFFTAKEWRLNKLIPLFFVRSDPVGVNVNRVVSTRVGTVGSIVDVGILTQLSQKKFVNVVSALGKIHHPNVLDLKAYYWGSGKTVCVFRFMPNGSVSSLLQCGYAYCGSRCGIGLGRFNLTNDETQQPELVEGQAYVVAGLTPINSDLDTIYMRARGSTEKWKPLFPSIIQQFR